MSEHIYPTEGNSPTPNLTKFAELVLFFAYESRNDAAFGATKLNKLLFLTDFSAFGALGRSITGIDYVHREHGPTPAWDALNTVLSDLEAAGKLAIQENEWSPGKIKKRPLALRQPDMSGFTQDELALARKSLDDLRPMSARQVSEWSHELNGWISTVDGETIPYNLAYVWQRRPVTEAVQRWAQETARSLGA